MEYTVEFDSSERDPIKYPNSNDFVVNLSKPLYNVNLINLISARIPNPQVLINDGNKQFDFDGSTIILEKGNYTATALATELQTKLLPTVDNVSYVSKTNSITYSNIGGTDFTFNFYGGSNGFATNSLVGTPANIMGFNHSNVTSTSNTLTSNTIDLSGPSSFIVRITNGADDFTKAVYMDDGVFSFGDSPVLTDDSPPLSTSYTGRVLTRDVAIGSILDYNGTHDPLQYEFHKGPEKSIQRLRLRIYYNNGNKLIPYDFGANNFVLKFDIKCELDKIYSMINDEMPPDIPPPVTLQTLEPDDRVSNKRMITIVISVIGLVFGLMILMSSKRQPQGVQASS